MRGHVQKKDKNWYVVLEDDRVDNQRKRPWISVRKALNLNKRATKAQAEELLIKLLSEKQRGIYIDPSTSTIGEYLDQWIETYCKPNLKQKTWESYEDNIRLHLKDGIGNIAMDKLKPADLNTHYTKLLISGRTDGTGGLSHRTVRYCHTILRKALNDAVKLELVVRNVCDAVDPPKDNAKKRSPWTAEQADAFANIIMDHRMSLFFLLLICTGMRRGEILGLKWADLDLTKATISISNAATTVRKGLLFDGVKTESSIRQISMHKTMAEMLGEHRKNQLAEFMALGIRDKDKRDLVFVSQKGTPLNPPNLHRLFKKMIVRAGVPNISIHDIRHTYATLQLRLGVNMKIIQELLGHANWSTTANIYTAIMGDQKVDAANTFGDFFLGKRNGREIENEAK